MSENNNSSKSNPSESKFEMVANESSENLSPWADRWQNKRIGFHLSEVNPILQQYVDRLLPKTDDGSCSNTRIFVPLCGKTVDLAFLAPISTEVVGVEGIRKALEEFAEEQPNLKVGESKEEIQDGFERWQGDKIALLRGDYFELNDSHTNGKFGAIYDRASMVAIQPSLRKAYVDVLGRLISPGGKILLVALERKGEEEATKKGPPFSLPETVVRELFEGLDWVESVSLLDQSDQLEKKPEDRARYEGLTQLLESVLLIQAKP